ncbi:BtrH N-terminal domain-containing protein [Streptomyces sp. NBC_01537]|uniref:hypothetical protein n=1 Tax=Streptomyces sp. NBC_01537 TaxID=2903896 RepID=UPI00386FF774
MMPDKNKPGTLSLPHPRYTGETPFGSCYQQSVANLLEWQGLGDAADAIGMSWGFSWTSGDFLEGSGRWLESVRTVHGTDLEDLRFPLAGAALEFERESVASGHPVAAAVDSYFLPSPFENQRHITHCVLVIGADSTGVQVVDPMNNVSPAFYGFDDWVRMRSASCAQESRTFLVRSKPDRVPGPLRLARALADDLRAGKERDEAALSAYLTACDEGIVTGTPDVSGVAAERLYLALFLKALAQRLPGLRPAVEAVSSLERRWYLAHTLAIEPGGVSRARHIRLIRDLGQRELEQRRRTLALLEALPDDTEENE